ncbi:MAG TPA: peptide chain release factor N(5)-glutamine methyltransferase [Candidatus Krumholzibacteria bacterium]|nr:peptide chain release factor N(5)-glutamine methyltransferase [Candidatus Krumholzibacteria bacterium]HRX50787.1 peptide chain release factor N(5)-glutamine methyltransferase [Candidatus Krumholzibacteria bacterium]
MPAELKTVRELVQATADWFASKGLESPRLNAERLLGDVLGLTRLELYLHHDRPLTPEETDRYRALVKRRGAGEPLQTLIGETQFYSRSFKVEAGVFIPRPETELLVERCVGLLTGGTSSLLAPVAVEIGCGTGIIGVSLAAEIPRLHVWATDVNPQAVALTETNARRLGVAARVEALAGRGFEPLPQHLRGSVHLLVSNPPYIASDVIATLDREVAEHDPRAALDGGPDGLDAYRALAAQAGAWLAPDGLLALEIGHDQGGTVPEIFAAAGFTDLSMQMDYNGLPRTVTGRLPANAGARTGAARPAATEG